MPARSLATKPNTCEIELIDERQVKRGRQVRKSSEAVAALADTFKRLGDLTRIQDRLRTFARRVKRL